MNDFLREALLKAGADVVGFADIEREILDPEISHLNRAISIGVCRKLNEDTLRLHASLRKKASSILKTNGYRYLSIPPVHENGKRKFIASLYPLFTHRIAATSAGLGWIGRNGLLINPEYGPRLSFSTVLTDAPLIPDSPVEQCLCGECLLCVEHCPAGAIIGNEWSRDNPYVELVIQDRCEIYKKNMRPVNGRSNCGLCINICPYGRKWISK